MTLADLARLLRRYWLSVASCIVICLLIGAAASRWAIPKEYEAMASVSAIDPSAALGADTLMSTMLPLAKDIASDAPEGISIKIEGPKAAVSAAESRILKITVSGPNAQDCTNVANSVANNVADDASAVFEELDDDYEAAQSEKREIILNALRESDENSEALLEAAVADKDYSHCAFLVAEASGASEVSVSSSKVLLISLLIGVLVSLAGLGIVEVVCRPLKSLDDIRTVCDLPVLSSATVPDKGAFLWANICFRADERPCSIAIVPLSSGGTRKVVDLLEEAIPASDVSSAGSSRIEDTKEDGSSPVELLACEPLTNSVLAAYAARTAACTLVVIRFWKDTRHALAGTIEELKLAKANVIGAVVLSE